MRMLVLGSHEEAKGFDQPIRDRGLEPFHAGLDPSRRWIVDLYGDITSHAGRSRIPKIPGLVGVVCGCTDTDYLRAIICYQQLGGPPAAQWEDKTSQGGPFRPPILHDPYRLDVPVVVVRPRVGRGSRGVTVVSREQDMRPAIAYAGGHVDLAEYIPGPQVSVEAVILDGHTHVVAIGDRYYQPDLDHPWHPVELGGNVPSALPPETQADIRAVAQAYGQYVASAWLCGRSSPLKLDMVVGPQGPLVIESHLRLGGGWFATRQIPEVHAVYLVDVAVDIALGRAIDPRRVSPMKPDGAIAWRLKPDGTRAWGRADTIAEAIRLAEEAAC